MMNGTSQRRTGHGAICLCLFVACLFGGSLRLSAQELAPIKGAFRMMAVDGDLEGLHYAFDSKDVPLEIRNQQRSSFYKLPPEKVVTFYRLKADPTGKLVRQPEFEANFTAGGDLPLVIVSKMRGGTEEKIETKVVRDDLASFPMGSFRVVNFSDVPLEARVDGGPSGVGPRSDVIIDALKDTEKPTVYFQLMLAAGGRRDLVFASNWSHSKAMRVMVLLHPPKPPAKMPTVTRVGEIADVLFERATTASR